MLRHRGNCNRRIIKIACRPCILQKDKRLQSSLRTEFIATVARLLIVLCFWSSKDVSSRWAPIHKILTSTSLQQWLWVAPWSASELSNAQEYHQFINDLYSRVWISIRGFIGSILNAFNTSPMARRPHKLGLSFLSTCICLFWPSCKGVIHCTSALSFLPSNWSGQTAWHPTLQMAWTNVLSYL